MVNVSVARRYARALIELGAESGKLDAMAQVLSDLVAQMQQNPELSDVLLNPAYTKLQKLAVLQKVVGEKMPAELDSALRLMVDRQRLSYLPDIYRLFRDMADLRAGRVRGKVISAAPLPPETLDRLEKSLERITQRNVLLDAAVDPALLGGVTAEVGSVLYDGSVKSQLEDLRRSLSRR